MTVYQKDTTELNISACDSFAFRGDVFNESPYAYDLSNAFGCDSVVLLHLTIHPSVQAFLGITTCVQYEWLGNVYTESGIYADTLKTVYGCDSIITPDLTILPGMPTTDTIELMACDSVVVNGLVYYQDGTYLQTLTNGFGCDSLLTIVVDVLQPSDSYLVAEACQSYVLMGRILFQRYLHPDPG